MVTFEARALDTNLVALSMASAKYSVAAIILFTSWQSLALREDNLNWSLRSQRMDLLSVLLGVTRAPGCVHCLWTMS